MEFTETKMLLKRISSNYPSFICDDYKLREWHNELKKYDFDDVNKKLEEHMRSSEYGAYEPKLYFLTKYLKTVQDKTKKENFSICCEFCGEYVPMDKFDKHYDRCSSIDYINRQSLLRDGKEIDKNKYLNMSDEDFENFYDKLLQSVYNRSKDENEKYRIRKYFETKCLSKI